MVYTAPATPLPGDVLTAAFWDTHVRDRILQTPEALATAAAQQVFSTGVNAVAMVHGSKYKTADHTIISQATLQNDAHLAWTIAANEAWAFRAVLKFTMASGGPLVVNGAFTVPAAASGWYSVLRSNVDIDAALGTPSHGDYSIATTPVAIGSASVTGRLVVLDGVVINGANAGTVQFQWCQSSSTAINTLLRLGSYIDLKRLA